MESVWLERAARYGAQVPVGYVVTVSLFAAMTLLAVAPVRRPPVLGRMTWLVTLILNEQPFLVFEVLVLSTLLAVSDGDVDARGAWLAVGAVGLTAVGLAIVARRQRLAGPAAERALGEALGPGWRAGVVTRTSRRRPWARVLFAPWLVRRRDVERVANISYGDGGRSNTLDVYRRRSRPADGPVLIHLHGGRFAMGGKNREARPLLYRLASQGWVCISANYHLSRTPAAGFPQHLVDVKRVVAWVREHGAEFGADPRMVFLSGSSAGAHLTAMAALTADDPAFQPGFEGADTSITAAVGLYGYYGELGGEALVPTSPLAYARADAPPFLVVHGDHDTLTPVEGARLLVERLRDVSSNPVVYVELPGAQHVFDLFHSIRFDAVVDAIEDFAAWVRSGREAHTA